MADRAIEAFVVIGAAFVVLAGIGVLRFRDAYARMHAATKASTLGIALIGIAGAMALGDAAGKILLAVVFIFVTAPSAAHLVGRAAYRVEGIAIDLEARDDLAAADDEPERRRTAPLDDGEGRSADDRNPR